MATMCFAMWLQSADATDTRRLVLIALIIMAIAVAGISVIMLVIAVKAMKTIKELGSTAEEIKGKVMPLLDEVMLISKTSREMLQDAAPKVKLISENLVKTTETLVETSKVARGAVEKIDVTVTDANLRAQRQVARVDGMVSAALTTTAEVADTIANGIKVPAQKIAVIAIQAKVIAEGVLAKVRSMAEASPFGRRKTPVDTVPEPPLY
jgi:methyl-accepting chemotaxis protein